VDVSAYAKGVLSLLAAKNLGVGFGQAADFIQPTIDIERFLALNSRTGKAFSVPNVAGTFDANYLTIPSNEMWILRAGMGYWQTIAASTLQQGAIIAQQPDSSNAVVIGTPMGPVAANGVGLSTLLIPNSVWGPGTKFGLYTGTVSGGPNPASLALFVDVLAV